MPKGLEIDHKSPLNGLISAYNEQVLICTGKDDWTSKIEEENSGDNLAADLKELLGRGGRYADPFNNISILNSSFPPSKPAHRELINSSAYLFPSFKYIPFLPRVSFDSVEALVRGYLLPEKLHTMHDELSPIHRDNMTRQIPYQRLLRGVQDVEDVMVLVCGHGGRDQRCGIMGPPLQQEFERELPKQGLAVLKGPVVDEQGGPRLQGHVTNDVKHTARVGLISHIGGHKFAGNVIVYLPSKLKNSAGDAHSLAGCGVWYGRVEPKHVRGIIETTISRGKVIEDMFRGGIRSDRSIIR